MTAEGPLLDVRDLSVHFFTDAGVARAVDAVSFTVGRGDTFCLVGESGCGKSVTALGVMRLVPPPGRVVGGEILFGGRRLLDLPEAEMRAHRGSRIGMIFQEPMTSLNPVFTIGEQIAEGVRLHVGASRREARAVALDMLRRVRVPDAERRLAEYPHQLSGGMQQRAMIAMALACRPELLIADEPTTALDVTTQACILDLLNELRAELGMAVLLITHDLGVVAEVADGVAVMYAGRVVEQAGVESLFRRPRHPYTIGLMRSLPSRSRPGARLPSIPGFVPDARRYPLGCRFHPRCPLAMPPCARIEPELRDVAPGHRGACIRLAEYWRGDERAPEGLTTVDPLEVADG